MGVLDLKDSHQDQHLSRDAEEAEDLDIAYADRTTGRARTWKLSRNVTPRRRLDYERYPTDI
jgi:hypothetical protein